MANEKTAKISPQKRIAVLVLLIIAVTVATFAIVLPSMSTYHLYIADKGNEIALQDVKVKNADVIEYSGHTRVDGHIQVTFLAKNPGHSDIEVSLAGKDFTNTIYFPLQVSGSGLITREGQLDFNNWQIELAGFTMTLLLLSILLMSEFVARIRRSLYSYKTLQIGGIAIFETVLMLMFLLLSLFVLPRYMDYNASLVLEIARSSFFLFIICAIPFVVAFGIALSISNIRLITKEGFRPVNLLGIALSVFLVLALFLCLFSIDNGTPGEAEISHLLMNVQFVAASVFCFFLCFMLSTTICGLVAAKRVPELDKDFIIILGCGIREDGTLFPLLQGRVDRAIWFWRKQFEETGKRAVFVPSGGQGPDEVTSEGAAMERYLLEQGIPRECIMPETASRSTYENMAFSKKLIDERVAKTNAAAKADDNANAKANANASADAKANANASAGAEVIFSTTNYHTFRSGILAGQAGLHASGIGSKARWYFWPNAFVREFAGLLASAWKLELCFFAAIAALAVAMIVLL